MCGIQGVITKELFDQHRWGNAMKVQGHRGPDDNGSWEGKISDWHIRLGHQRLSIIDLSLDAAQPMVHPITGSILIFNGEIYNYIELRTQLERLGHHFFGNSDTEVLLNALEYYDFDHTLSMLNGMWAFAWLNIKKQQLFLSRDRFGEKPLYFSARNDTIFFSSELKTILTLLGQRQILNMQTVGEFLALNLLDVTNASFFNGIEQVKAGTYSCFSLNRKFIRSYSKTYWNCPLIPEKLLQWDDFILELRSRFLKSVDIRLRSDVPVGILLSGGIDSSSIASTAKILRSEPLHLLSAVHHDSRFDETPFIDIMSKHLGWPITKVILPNNPIELFNHIEDATWYMDGPIGSLSHVSHYLLMKAANELGITVLLSGQGADESFCGYLKYFGFHLQTLIRNRKFILAAKSLKGFLDNKTVISQFNFGDAQRYLPKLFRNKRLSIFGEALDYYIEPNIGLQSGNTLNQRQLLDLTNYSVPSINHSEDRMSMAWSREIRLPFLDHNLIEMLISAPSNYKINKGWTKYALRCAMEPYLPAKITWRKDKQGFSTPEGEWLKKELKHHILNYYFVPESNIFKLGIIKRDRLLERFNRYCLQKPQQGFISFRELFTPVTLEIWLRKYSQYINMS